jgi:putative FmdB family regulatory protein
MPIYQYKCRECGEVSEFLVPSSSSSRTLVCSGCGSHNLDRLISAPRLLKGGGAARGTTCCGRIERCEKPPCSTDGGCRRH